jgi:transcription elongation factor GreA
MSQRSVPFPKTTRPPGRAVRTAHVEAFDVRYTMMMIATGAARWGIRTSVRALAADVNRVATVDGMAEQQVLSRQAYERLRAELEELTGEGRIDIARKIEAARALGDLSENGDYHAAKDQQGKMEARIRHLEGILKDAVVSDDPAPSDGSVAVGCVVEIRFVGDDDTEKYLVGSIEERHDEYEVVSPGSPLGEALMGRKPGEQTSYEVNGNAIKVEIVGVTAP